MKTLEEKTRTQTQTQTVTLDYPQKDDKISSSHYAFRISASEDAEHVAVSIDGCDPIPCRRAAGYFWYDWSNFMPGRHEVLVVAAFPNGVVRQTKIRRVTVESNRDPRRD